MRLSESLINRIASFTLRQLKEKDTIDIVKSEKEVQHKIADVITANLKEEVALDEEAKNMLEKVRSQSSENIDERKMFMMIKKQLAKDKGFIL